MIRHFRRLKGLTMEGLGQRVGVSKESVRRWELGYQVRLHNLEVLAEELGVDVKDLFAAQHTKRERSSLSARVTALEHQISRLMDRVYKLEVDMEVDVVEAPEEELGRIAYEAYLAETQGHAHDQVEPRWATLPSSHRRAWVEAAEAVARHIIRVEGEDDVE